MAKPPNYDQKTYRGRVRADMRSAKNHIGYLLDWDKRYSFNEPDQYPLQLASPEDMFALRSAHDLLIGWLASLGPIPDPKAAERETARQQRRADAIAADKAKRAYTPVPLAAAEP